MTYFNIQVIFYHSQTRHHKSAFAVAAQAVQVRH